VGYGAELFLVSLRVKFKSKFMYRLFTSLFVLACGSIFAAPLIDGLQGSGQQEDPVLIGSVNDLRLLSAFIMNGANYSTATAGKYFKMTNDISFEAKDAIYDFDGDGIKESNLIPVGGRQGEDASSNYRLFQGIFDGDGHIISGLRMLYGENLVNYVGLFGVIWDATIKNVGIEDGEFSGYGCVAALCGQAQSNSNISGSFVYNCSVSGNWMYAGGLCAANASGSTIKNCYVSDVSVSGNDFVGGLCGLNNPGSGVSFIKNCYSVAEVETKVGSAYYGGFCGYSTNDTSIVNSYVADGWQVSDSVEPGLFSLRGTVKDKAFMTSAAFVDTLNNGLDMAVWQAHCGGEGTPSLLWECDALAVDRIALRNNNVLRAYPNPVFDKITVDGAQGRVTVYDPRGRAVAGGHTVIDLSALSAGQYIVKDKTSAVKIIKN
jgi:hypothetical protein